MLRSKSLKLVFLCVIGIVFIQCKKDAYDANQITYVDTILKGNIDTTDIVPFLDDQITFKYGYYSRSLKKIIVEPKYAIAYKYNNKKFFAVEYASISTMDYNQVVEVKFEVEYDDLPKNKYKNVDLSSITFEKYNLSQITHKIPNTKYCFEVYTDYKGVKYIASELNINENDIIPTSFDIKTEEGKTTHIYSFNDHSSSRYCPIPNCKNEYIRIGFNCHPNRQCEYYVYQCNGIVKHQFQKLKCWICEKSDEDTDIGKCSRKKEPPFFKNCPKCKSSFIRYGIFKHRERKCESDQYKCNGEAVYHIFHEIKCRICHKYIGESSEGQCMPR